MGEKSACGLPADCVYKSEQPAGVPLPLGDYWLFKMMSTTAFTSAMVTSPSLFTSAGVV